MMMMAATHIVGVIVNSKIGVEHRIWADTIVSSQGKAIWCSTPQRNTHFTPQRVTHFGVQHHSWLDTIVRSYRQLLIQVYSYMVEQRSESGRVAIGKWSSAVEQGCARNACSGQCSISSAVLPFRTFYIVLHTLDIRNSFRTLWNTRWVQTCLYNLYIKQFMNLYHTCDSFRLQEWEQKYHNHTCKQSLKSFCQFYY